MFLRYDIGILIRQNGACFSKLASAKLQHERADSKFFANLWRFEKLKTAHSPSVYWGKIIFLYRNGVQISKIHLTQKNDTSAKLTIDARYSLICTLLVTVKK